MLLDWLWLWVATRFFAKNLTSDLTTNDANHSWRTSTDRQEVQEVQSQPASIPKTSHGQNHEDSSDFNDCGTVLIATAASTISQIFAPPKKFQANEKIDSHCQEVRGNQEVQSCTASRPCGHGCALA